MSGLVKRGWVEQPSAPTLFVGLMSPFSLRLVFVLYHILLRLSRSFLNFYGRGLISMGRNKGQNKKPLQACLSFFPFEERYRSHQVFPCCQNIDLLSASVLTVSRLSNHNGWCKMSESNCSSCSQNKGATITLHPAYKWHYRSSHGIFFQI